MSLRHRATYRAELSHSFSSFLVTLQMSASNGPNGGTSGIRRLSTAPTKLTAPGSTPLRPSITALKKVSRSTTDVSTRKITSSKSRGHGSTAATSASARTTTTTTTRRSSTAPSRPTRKTLPRLPPPTRPSLPTIGGGATLQLTHTPVKLTHSTFDLFTRTTGEPMRATDPYAQFLMGPRRVKLHVPSYRELEEMQKEGRVERERERERRARERNRVAKRVLESVQSARADAAVGGGPKSAVSNAAISVTAMAQGLTVGRATSGFAKRATSAAAGHRQPRKPAGKKRFRTMTTYQYRADMMSKWERLEDMRIKIVARMQSLRHCHGELQSLKHKNSELREQYATLTRSTNAKVTRILLATTTQNDSLTSAHRDRKRRRYDAICEMKDFDAAWGDRINGVNSILLKRRRELHEVERELLALRNFKAQATSDPAHHRAQLALQLRQQSALNQHHQDLLAQAEQNSHAQSVSHLSLTHKHLDTVIQRAYGTLDPQPRAALEASLKVNGRLKKEVKCHEELGVVLRAEIDRLNAEIQRRKEGRRAGRDRRRDVLVWKRKEGKAVSRLVDELGA
ncbi:uncharacterized protein EV422DRAFT_63318 [Fimicolochytrium jonesii]|uniref:uncharacterized protein n=1 Tax=Fimicolochytrium jonesii TaxID=1396493 RepID=UPI0022FEB345|nr:uncharacterized protein EV422DRAFT_63318 [Fimicolochytrium jonesii]KAI8820790.1 hypothetical protein EV422DRAFT_63318 [Fimicolochytrium jonesii]